MKKTTEAQLEAAAAERAPVPPILPQTGGCFIRTADGQLIPENPPADAPADDVKEA